VNQLLKKAVGKPAYELAEGVGLYMDSPDNAVVLNVSEKTNPLYSKPLARNLYEKS
jgi:hypothetical protein